MPRITGTIDVRRRIEDGAHDRYGTPVPAWAPPVPVEVYAVAPRAATTGDPEPGAAGRPELLIVGLTVYMRPDAEIGSGDRVDYLGETWEVVGLPGVWGPSPVGGARITDGGVVVNLEKVTG